MATEQLEPLRLPFPPIKRCEAPDCNDLVRTTTTLTLRGGKTMQVCLACYEALCSRASRYTDPVILTRERVDGRSSIGRTKRRGKKMHWPEQSDDVG